MPRTLTEGEVNDLYHTILNQVPAGLDEPTFNRYVSMLFDKAAGEAENKPAPVEGSALGRFVSNAWDQLNPLQAAKAVIHAGLHPVETGEQILAARDAELAKAKDAYSQGRYAEMLGHGAASLIPLVGPAAAQAGEQIAAGDVAGGLGKGAGLLAPVAARPALEGLRAAAPDTLNAAAASLDEAAKARQASVLALKANTKYGKRINATTAKALEQVPEGTDLAAWTFKGLKGKLEGYLDEAKTGLDEAADARFKADTFPTAPIIRDLEAAKGRQVAPAVEASRVIPSVEGVQYGESAAPAATYDLGASLPARDLPQPMVKELRRMVHEMDAAPYRPRVLEQAEKGGGLAYVEGTGGEGASVYGDILQHAPGTSQILRGTIQRQLEEYLGGGQATHAVQGALEVAAKRLEGLRGSISTPELPASAGDVLTRLEGREPPAAAAGGLQKVARPLGEDVVPQPNQVRTGTIDQVIDEVRRLGPVARYESLRRIRQAWDQVANKGGAYSPTVTPDYAKVAGEAEGAADATAALREHLARFDPPTAAANAKYSVFKSLTDAAKAIEEVEKARPKVGRQIMARLTMMLGGEHVGGLAGGVIGYLGGPIVDAALAGGPTTQLQTARLFQTLAQALRSGDLGTASSAASRLRQVAGASLRTVPGINQITIPAGPAQNEPATITP